MNIFSRNRLERKSKHRILALVVVTTLGYQLPCQSANDNDASDKNDFAPLNASELALGQRNSAQGLPAENYWQQQVDYDIDAHLTKTQQHWNISASAHIHYVNNSPETLQSLYFLLDHNALKADSLASKKLQHSGDSATLKARKHQAKGFRIDSIRQENKALGWIVDDTLLRVDLDKPLAPGKSIKLHMAWQLPLTDKVATKARSGVEILPDGSSIILAAQWFPRATAFTDYAGWQLRPFLQQGEFSTEFGHYSVRITAPTYLVFAASGELKNPEQILNDSQLATWKKLQTPLNAQGRSTAPIDSAWLVDSSLAHKNRAQEITLLTHNERPNSNDGTGESTKTWHFTGQSLRDFAFAASSSFLWQAGNDPQGRVLNSYYPEEAKSLWQPFGLDAIRHTLAVFDNATFTLPYRNISIVNAAGIGMEYPGLSSIATRPEREKNSALSPSYDALTKYDFIGSVIHEVGHNYIPMALNTDEREWAWLDEGLVSFIEYRAEHSWEANFDVIYGEPLANANYLASPEHQPIMINADQIHQKIANAYNKTASNLNLLRNFVMGPELFDQGLRHFSQTWQGKRATPGDFFNTMNSIANQDLSWFWRSWFYQARNLDWAINHVIVNGQSQKIVPGEQRNDYQPLALADQSIDSFIVEKEPELRDAYSLVSKPHSRGLISANTHTATDLRPTINAKDKDKDKDKDKAYNAYSISIENKATALLPIPVQVRLTNKQIINLLLPVDLWKNASTNSVGHAQVEWRFSLPKHEQIQQISLDPFGHTPDSDRSNNSVELIQP